jgi:hypothetical protein
MQVFLDSDGVLADFDKLAGEILGMPSREFEKKKHTGGAATMWQKLYEHEDFFYKIPKMEDADELVEGVIAMGFDPIVLTGIPSKDGSDWAIGQKIRWYAEKYPDLPVITCKSKDKLLHMIEGKHNVLIDDWTQHKAAWERAGGTFIVHTSAKKSLEELKFLKGIIESFDAAEEGEYYNLGQTY